MEDPKISKDVQDGDPLRRYFRSPEHRRVFLSVVRDGTMSLRNLSWFVTGYCLRHSVLIITDNQICNVTISYEAALRQWGREGFDPFNPSTPGPVEQILLHDEDRPDLPPVITSRRQLRFFVWAIENNVIGCANEYRGAILKDYQVQHRKRARGENSVQQQPPGRKKKSRKAGQCRPHFVASGDTDPEANWFAY